MSEGVVTVFPPLSTSGSPGCFSRMTTFSYYRALT
jgi:hypothetical protein